MAHLLTHVVITQGCYLFPYSRHQLPQLLKHRLELRKVLLRPDVGPALHEHTCQALSGAS